MIKLMALMDYDAGMFSKGSVRGLLSGTMIKMIDMMDYDAGRVKTRR